MVEDFEGARSLNRILKSDCCAGCGLCASISHGALTMNIDEAGYLRPKQQKPLSIEKDELINKICPGMNLDLKVDQQDNHVLWGPLIEVRSGVATNSELAHHASSGGVLSALLLHLLESGDVDYVVQVSASKTAPIENIAGKSLVYEDVYQAAGSRYGPSAPLEDLDHYLEKPGRFALVGKPCDIAGAKAYSEHDARVAEKIPIFLSFFCAGIPSFNGTREILKQLDVEEHELAAFKYRGDGWPGFASATTRDGRSASMDYHSSWGNILSKHVQFRCKICPDGTGGFADVVCADAWHSDENGYPLFEEKGGRSLIISRSDIGEKLIQSAIANGAIQAESFAQADIEAMQPGQVGRKRFAFSRLAAMALLFKSIPRYRGFQLLKAAKTGSLILNIKNFLGTGRRLVFSRRIENRKK